MLSILLSCLSYGLSSMSAKNPVVQLKLTSYYTLHDKPVNFAEVRLVHC